MKPTRLVLLLAAAGLASNAFGADLLGVYKDAQVSDPVYQGARATYNAGIERLPQARAGYLPNVIGSASAFKNKLDRDYADDFTYNNQTYAVTLTQPLFRWQNWVAIGQAEKQVLQTEASFTIAKQDLIVRTAQAYFDVLLAQDNVALSEAQKKAFSEQLAQAKRNFEVGTATIVDTLEAQARYDQTVAKEISDKNDLEVKRQALQQLIGKPAESLVPLKDPLTLAPPKPEKIEDWVNAAGTSSYSVAISRAGYEIAQKEVDRARAGHYPTVDLSAQWVYNKNPNLTSGIGTLAQNTGSVGVSVSVPIFAGGGTQSLVRQALANKDRAQQDLENTQRTVAQAVRQGYLNVTSGIAQVRALEQALASTQSQLDSTILGRDVGVRTSVDVLNAQQQVIQTRRDLQQARYNYLLNTLRLKSASGTLDEPDLEQVNRALGRG
ncbi:MAG: TolC family outer membrane protein [Betaproteobacteria bacterium]|nr:TolC family outer membrane protein [Betaproteobacteria bacterium]